MKREILVVYWRGLKGIYNKNLVVIKKTDPPADQINLSLLIRIFNSCQTMPLSIRHIGFYHSLFLSQTSLSYLFNMASL